MDSIKKFNPAPKIKGFKAKHFPKRTKKYKKERMEDLAEATGGGLGAAVLRSVSFDKSDALADEIGDMAKTPLKRLGKGLKHFSRRGGPAHKFVGTAGVATGAFYAGNRLKRHIKKQARYEARRLKDGWYVFNTEKDVKKNEKPHPNREAAVKHLRALYANVPDAKEAFLTGRTKVDSSNIRSIGYDPDKKRLRIEFKGGGVYDYDGVDPDTHQDFMSAPSKGSFFHDIIRSQPDRFPFRKRPVGTQIAKLKNVFRKEGAEPVEKIVSPELREELAELEHKQWLHWARRLVREGWVDESTKRHWSPKFVPYENLPEEEKKKDRIWADKIIRMIGEKKEKTAGAYNTSIFNADGVRQKRRQLAREIDEVNDDDLRANLQHTYSKLMMFMDDEISSKMRPKTAHYVNEEDLRGSAEKLKSVLDTFIVVNPDGTVEGRFDEILAPLRKGFNRALEGVKMAGGPGSGVTHNNTAPITELPLSPVATIGKRQKIMDLAPPARRVKLPVDKISYVAQRYFVIKKLANLLSDPDGGWLDVPIQVLHYKGEYHLLDGHHRFLAARRLGKGALLADIWEVDPTMIDKTATRLPVFAGAGVFASTGLNALKQKGEIRSGRQTKMDPYRLFRAGVVGGALGAGASQAHRLKGSGQRIKQTVQNAEHAIDNAAKITDDVAKQTPKMDELLRSVERVSESVARASDGVASATEKANKHRFYGIFSKGASAEEWISGVAKGVQAASGAAAEEVKKKHRPTLGAAVKAVDAGVNAMRPKTEIPKEAVAVPPVVTQEAKVLTRGLLRRKAKHLTGASKSVVTDGARELTDEDKTADIRRVMQVLRNSPTFRRAGKTVGAGSGILGTEIVAEISAEKILNKHDELKHNRHKKTADLSTILLKLSDDYFADVKPAKLPKDMKAPKPKMPKKPDKVDPAKPTKLKKMVA